MKKSQFSDFERQFVARALEELTGLHFSEDRGTEIERGLKKVQKRLNLAEPKQALRIFQDGLPPHVTPAIIAACFTVGETHFYRDHFLFDYLSEWFLSWGANPLNTTEKLRVWTTACSTGEEAYTLAVLLSRCLTASQRKSLHLLATDINPDSLAWAKNGVYTKWSFRDVPPAFRELHFTPSGSDRWQVKPEVKSLVNFASINLIKGPYPAESFDIILCRNVVMYFSHDTARLVIGRLVELLKPGGLFVVAAAEAWLVEGLEHLDIGAGTFRRPLQDTLVLPTEETTMVPESGEPNEPVPQQEQFHSAEFPNLDADALVNWSLAKKKADLGHLEEALTYCQSVLQRDPQMVEAYRLMARAQESLGRLQDASFSLHQALFLEPSNYSDRFLMGSILERMNNHKAALATYKIALQLIEDGAHESEYEDGTQGWVKSSLESSIERLKNA